MKSDEPEPQPDAERWGGEGGPVARAYDSPETPAEAPADPEPVSEPAEAAPEPATVVLRLYAPAFCSAFTYVSPSGDTLRFDREGRSVPETDVPAIIESAASSDVTLIKEVSPT